MSLTPSTHWYEIIEDGYHVTDGRSYQTSLRPMDNMIGICGGRVDVSEFGLVCIRPGYWWDGASGPAIDSFDFMDASLLHDVYFQMMRERNISIWNFPRANWAMFKMSRRYGMHWFRASYAWLTVTIFGFPSASPWIHEMKQGRGK